MPGSTAGETPAATPLNTHDAVGLLPLLRSFTKTPAHTSRQKFPDQFADGLAFGAAGGFGLDGFDDLPHLLFAGGAGFLARGANQMFASFGRERGGQE